MAINDISLTAGMRSNLLALQGTAAALGQTQDRLSSGKKVNSALDNPTNFFSAQSHLQRASDLGDRKDGMSEGIQTVKAANAGITSITSLIQAAKGLASSALGTTDVAARKSYQDQFNTLRKQIDDLATDSGYKGTNLLKGATLTVQFNEKTDTSTLAIVGFDASTAATGLKITTPDTKSFTTSTAEGNSATNADTALTTAGTTLGLIKDSFDNAKLAQDALTQAGTDLAAFTATPTPATDEAAGDTAYAAALVAKQAAAAILSTDSVAAGLLTDAANALAGAANTLGSPAQAAGAATDGLTPDATILLKADADGAATALDDYTVVTTTATGLVDTAVTAATTAESTATGLADTATTAGDTVTATGEGKVAAAFTGAITDLGAAKTALTTIGAVTLATYDAATNGAAAATAGTTAGTTAATVADEVTAADSLAVAGWDNTDATAGATSIGLSSKALDAALTTLRTQSSALASNLSVVTTRQDFTSNMISTLTTGADNLTLADMNQEGANMLMLQTRQSLGTTALSLSSQAAQSVLKLF